MIYLAMAINFQAKVAVPQGLDPRRVDSYLGKILLGDKFYSSNIRICSS